MSPKKTLDVLHELTGMLVVVPDTSERLGRVADLILHPIQGRVLGLTVRTSEGKERALVADDFFIFSEVGAVLAAEGALSDLEDLSSTLSGSVRASSELVGTRVVTEEGKLLGYVSGVHLLEKRLQVVYHVTASNWQRLFNGGFFIAGDLPHAYSRDGARLIVPADTKDHYAFPSLAAAIAPRIGEMAPTGESQ